MMEAEGFRESLHPTLIVNCVANAFLSFTAIVLNVITIQALRKTPSLSRTLKTLLLNLAISDLGVGLLVQPLYVASLVMENKQNTSNIAFYAVRKAHIIQRQLFVSGSFLSVFVLTVDRFLAIHLHLRYQELVTHKRVVAVVVSTWCALRSFPSSVLFNHGFFTCNHCSCLYHNYRIALLQNIRSRETPHKSDSRSASATSSTEWRNAKCSETEKNGSCYILRVCGVFSLLFASSLYCFC